MFLYRIHGSVFKIYFTEQKTFFFIKASHEIQLRCRTIELWVNMKLQARVNNNKQMAFANNLPRGWLLGLKTRMFSQKPGIRKNKAKSIQTVCVISTVLEHDMSNVHQFELDC